MPPIRYSIKTRGVYITVSRCVRVTQSPIPSFMNVTDVNKPFTAQ